MDTNLKGVFFAVQACLPQMKSQRAGRLLVVSSITGPRVGLPDVTCYMASKGGVNAFVRGAALELAPYGITANTVSPGSILTEGIAQARGDEAVKEFSRVIPAGHLGDPEDVAYALLYSRLRSGPLRHRPRHRARRRPDSSRAPARRLSADHRAPPGQGRAEPVRARRGRLPWRGGPGSTAPCR